MKTKICQSCFNEFQTHQKVDGKWRSYNKRKFCLTCSPFGTKDKRHPKDRLKDLDGKRTCSDCRERKPLDAEHFCKSNSESSGFRWQCNDCNTKRVIATQQAQKLKCLEYKGGKCEICGYDRCSRSLHFHHKNPAEKDFTICKYRLRSWETIKAELDKCVLLCANCHGEVHDGLTVLEKNKAYPQNP